MKLKPLRDKVVVKRLEEEGKSKGGIIFPETAKEKPVMGKIIAVGKGRVLEDGSVRPIDVTVGDKIIFAKYAGSDFKIDGEEHLILAEDEILGVVE